MSNIFYIFLDTSVAPYCVKKDAYDLADLLWKLEKQKLMI